MGAKLIGALKIVIEIIAALFVPWTAGCSWVSDPDDDGESRHRRQGHP
jgi:hypothetical protein